MKENRLIQAVGIGLLLLLAGVTVGLALFPEQLLVADVRDQIERYVAGVELIEIQVAFAAASLVVIGAVGAWMVGNPDDPVTPQNRAESVITADTPTDVEGIAVVASHQEGLEYHSLIETNPNVAVYGRRAAQLEALSPGAREFFDRLERTVCDVYMTSAGVTESEAKEAIATGEWTESRRAAAFLATQGHTDDTFTVFERLYAWLAPERAFSRNVQAVLTAIDAHLESFATAKNHEERQ